jgi:hypothetical protein
MGGARKQVCFVVSAEFVDKAKKLEGKAPQFGML